jgi:hypothetical protein
VALAKVDNAWGHLFGSLIRKTALSSVPSFDVTPVTKKSLTEKGAKMP